MREGVGGGQAVSWYVGMLSLSGIAQDVLCMKSLGKTKEKGLLQLH